jgi:hypothetical protein
MLLERNQIEEKYNNCNAKLLQDDTHHSIEIQETLDIDE